jgi:hypothetical protein
MTGPVTFDRTTRRGRERVREVWTGVPVANCTPEDIAAAHAAGYEPDGGYFIGRDPRQMTQDELRAVGYQPKSLLAIIRAKCLDCVGGSPDEVRKCAAVTCELHPVRMNKNVWRAPPSDALREARRELALKTFGKSSDAVNGAPASDENDPGQVILPAEALGTPEPQKIEASAAPRLVRRAP